MLLLALWRFSFLSLCLGAVDIPKALDCSHPAARDREKCQQRVHDVVAISPHSSYAASIACKNCSHDDLTKPGSDPVKADQILFLNLTLSHNRRAILLNEIPIHPLQTIPTPPPFHATQLPPTFSNTNLSSGINCPNPFCHRAVDDCTDWCWSLPLSTIKLDYLYTKKLVKYKGSERDAASTYWEVSLDIIGGRSLYMTDVHWKFDDASQKTVWMLVFGKEISSSRKDDSKATDDLFSPATEGDKIYEYHIVDIKLEDRIYKFPARKSLSAWGKLRRFFGTDVWEDGGHRFLFLEQEWGSYGKEGTLRNIFGEFVHWDMWPLIWTVLGSTIGGSLLLWGGYKFHLWLVQQRELANWDGIDAVWDRLRREPGPDDEEDALLDGGYRDDPDEGSSLRTPRYTDEGSSPRTPRYTDEPRTMKPLPSKPLPEKPLPAVPLIDT